MAPDLFELQVEDPDYTDRTWTGNQSATYRGRLTGTWIGNAIQGVADLFGMQFHFIASIPLIIACVAVMIIGGSQTQQCHEKAHDKRTCVTHKNLCRREIEYQKS